MHRDAVTSRCDRGGSTTSLSSGFCRFLIRSQISHVCLNVLQKFLHYTQFSTFYYPSGKMHGRIRGNHTWKRDWAMGIREDYFQNQKLPACKDLTMIKAIPWWIPTHVTIGLRKIPVTAAVIRASLWNLMSFLWTGTSRNSLLKSWKREPKAIRQGKK